MSINQEHFIRLDKGLIKDKIIELYKAVATKGINCSFKEKHQAEILEWILTVGE